MWCILLWKREANERVGPLEVSDYRRPRPPKHWKCFRRIAWLKDLGYER